MTRTGIENVIRLVRYAIYQYVFALWEKRGKSILQDLCSHLWGSFIVSYKLPSIVILMYNIGVVRFVCLFRICLTFIQH